MLFIINTLTKAVAFAHSDATAIERFLQENPDVNHRLLTDPSQRTGVDPAKYPDLHQQQQAGTAWSAVVVPFLNALDEADIFLMQAGRPVGREQVLALYNDAQGINLAAAQEQAVEAAHALREEQRPLHPGNDTDYAAELRASPLLVVGGEQSQSAVPVYTAVEVSKVTLPLPEETYSNETALDQWHALEKELDKKEDDGRAAL